MDIPEWMQNRKIDVRAKGYSQAAQEILLAYGCKWGGDSKEPQYLEQHYIFISTKGWMTHSSHSFNYFIEHNNLEITLGELSNLEGKVIKAKLDIRVIL